MNERLTTSGLAELLADKTGLDIKRAESFFDALTSYVSQSIERNKFVKIFGLGAFKIVLVRERESVHIQTGERFVIPAHHKLSFIPDKEFRDRVNRPYAYLEPELIETTEEKTPKKVVIIRQEENIIDEPPKQELPEQPIEEPTRPESEEKAPKAPVPEEPSEQHETPKSPEVIEPTPLPELYESWDVPAITEEELYLYEEILKLTEEGKVPASAEIPEKILLSELDYGFTAIDQANDTGTDEAVTIADDDEEMTVEVEKTIYMHADNKEETVTSEFDMQAAEKKKRRFLLRWLLLLPFLILIGVGAATYMFWYYHYPNQGYPQQKQPSEVLSTMKTESADHLPMPIGRVPVSDEARIKEGSVIGSAEELNDEKELLANNIPLPGEGEGEGEKKNETSAKTAPKEEKQVVDWLAPTPENTKTQTTTKRADKPNQEIEERNKNLSVRAGSKTQTPETATTASTASTEKKIPARVRMSAGSSLTQIAMEYYGDKIFWVYIYEHNKDRIKNFDKIPVGTELRLPSPQTYGIDVKSKTSIQKARQKQSELMKWDNWDDYK